MNETIKTILTRHSCRTFLEQMPDHEMLKAIAKAGVSAPSSRNLQPWQIIVIKDKSIINEIDTYIMEKLLQTEKTIYDQIISRGGKILYNAPVMILVAIDPTDHLTAALDCGIVVENMALASSSLGLGNVICGFTRFAFDEKNGPDLKKRLGVKEGYEFGVSILIGHSDYKGKPHEPDFSKISFVE